MSSVIERKASGQYNVFPFYSRNLQFFIRLEDLNGFDTFCPSTASVSIRNSDRRNGVVRYLGKNDYYAKLV